MIKKVLFTFVTVAVAVASAATYHVRLLEDSTVNGNQLRAGEYKVDVLADQNKAIFHLGKSATEAPVKVENASNKFHDTSFRYAKDADGKLKLQEVNIGGSTTKLIFSE